jgi:mutator protein MutT
MPSKEIEVVAAIIEKGGKFLITKRLEKSHLGHCWEFPGGKLEPGESLEECAIRECQEEIGVQVKPIKKIRELRHTYPEIRVHLHFILCEFVSGDPKPLECSDLRWVSQSELEQFEFPAADIGVIEELKNQKRRF